MIKNVLFSVLLLLGAMSLNGQCSNDTIFSDVVFVVDNSGSIDSAEYAEFSNIIHATVNKVQAACSEAQVAVVHYGGSFGQETAIEYPLSKNNVISDIQRQFCTSLDMFGFCAGGGGDDLNFAMGALMTYFGNGSLNHNTANNLNIVIFTDAFDGAASCGQPNCSILRPFTNIDILKSSYGASVTVIGASSQANAALLQIYASPGGSYDLVNLDPDCATSFDGCVQPRKYIPIEFNSNVATTSDSIVACVQCQIQIVAGMTVDAGNMQMICDDLPQSATLTAMGSVGVLPYSYSWSHGAGSGATVSVSPAVTTTYYVTATDALNCTDVDSVTVFVQDCCSAYSVNAGPDVSVCSDLGESTTLLATTTGSGSSGYIWDNGLGTGASHIIAPSTTTTYSVTATSSHGCVDTDQVTVTADICGPDCDPDTTFTDVIFLLDNSGSIDDSEFAAFENIVLASLDGLKTNCPSSRRSVVHYGGINGTSTVVEYSLGQVTGITNINRQYCTSRTPSGICIGGGGDDLNNAIGDIMTFLNNGMLNRDPSNNLALVIFTDAFGFDTSCGQPNCSLILPTTNIDQMKADYDVDVSVVGISSQAEEVLLGIYASPGGSFNSPLYAPECPGSFDGCVLPRKYVQIEFNTPPATVAGMITSFVDCVIEIEPELSVDIGPDVTFCENLGGFATLTATIGAGMGVPPYSYQWSDGLGTAQTVNVTPAIPHTYFVTATDANLCTAVDSVLVSPITCNDCFADAGVPQPPRDVCLDNGQAQLPADANTGIFKPAGYEEIYILTNEDLIILDYSIGYKNFIVYEPGIYRIHTLIAEVSNPASDDYLDLNIIKINQSELFIIVNCIVDHGICADFDFPGRVHRVLGPEEMMCMTFENSINLCSDGIDNDQDGLVDCADEDCKPLINCLENTLIACNDLTDNDGDGLVDCHDPDCFAFTLCFERGDKCKDGIDNDGDGLIDCDDSSCFDSPACAENSAFTCKDGMDNDRDGLIDCQEASCKPFIVCAEYSEAACIDGIDNDRDGLVDCADADCKELLGEACNPREDDVTLCMDGIDNDDDGLIDCADPDCMTSELVDVEDDIQLLIETVNATCPNNDNGKIIFTGAAQNSNFQYSIDGGQSYQASSIFENLDVGPYDIAIKSVLGCVLYADAAITGDACIEICNNGADDDSDGLIDCADSQCNKSDPYNPQIINIITADCPNYNNGSFSIALMPQGIQFSIDGIIYQSLPKFSNLSDGTYHLTYRDQLGCYAGINVVIPRGIIDVDGDGVCDSEDECPGLDDGLIGTSCDDGNVCTINDIYDSACNCAGTIQDSDGDGVCDAEDLCPNTDNSIVGTACDDGDVCTTNDVYDSTCTCAGTIQDSDGDGVCDAEDPCPFFANAAPGVSCDDGNACTVNDVYDSSCNCAGTIQDSDGDGVCDAEDPCPFFANAAPGVSCDDGNACTVNDVYDSSCNCTGTIQDSDGDGVCDAEDPCPFFANAAPGVSCDDGNACTVNDVYDSSCNCTGTIQDSDGDGVCDAEDPCPFFANAAPGVSCDDGNACTVNDVYDSSCNCAGTIQDSDGDGVCDAEDPCPFFANAAPGVSCDDGNACTVNDVYDSSCNCAGTIQDSDGDGVCDAEDPCPFLAHAGPEISCDDGNPLTTNDVYDDNCNCSGIISNTPEICNNGLDDDDDGLIDCADEDCIIEVYTTLEVKLENGFGEDTYITNEVPLQENNYGNSTTLVVNEWAINPNEILSTHAHILLDFPIEMKLQSPSISLESATITLYADPLYTDYQGGQFGDNEALVHLLNEPWDENVVTWENRPSYHITPSATIAQSNNYEKINVDVTNLVDKILDEDLEFYGFLIHPKEKTPFKSLSYASSENSDQSRTPEIKLVFSEEICVNDTIPTSSAAHVSSLELNVMLQGACQPTGSLMKTDLNEGGYLPGQSPITFFGKATPAGQPFGEAPWFYEGDEGKNMKSKNKSNEDIYDPDVVDWVLVSLRTEAGKLSEIWQGAALLYNDGSIYFFNPVEIDLTNKEGYYVVIEHRNHLPIMSHQKIISTDGILKYDFTKQNSYTSILGIGQVQDDSGAYMMVAGNGELIVELSSDIDINTRDLTLWLQNNGANSSYFLEDYDMNGDINIKDRILWEKNNGLFTTLQTK